MFFDVLIYLQTEKYLKELTVTDEAKKAEIKIVEQYYVSSNGSPWYYFQYGIARLFVALLWLQPLFEKDQHDLFTEFSVK